MSTSENRPYVTAAEAALALGYAQGNYITTLCAAGKIPGAYKSGRIWMLPTAWIEERKKLDAEQGIVRGTKSGGHVTTGAGLKRKRPAYQPTGRKPGRPKKTI